MTGRLKFLALIVTVFVLAAGAAFAQSVISAKSGLLHYIEGEVTIDGKAVEMKTSQFNDIKEQQVLETGEGRAEVLLTPGVFLRLAENSSFRLLSNRLTDTRVEALSGVVLIEHGEISKDTEVTLIYKDRSITFAKSGLYRLDANSGSFRVYQGEARINGGGQSVTAKQSRELELNAPVLLANKFDNKTGDEFYRWASRRAGYLSIANISGAKALRDSGIRPSAGGMWYWNQWFGMYTYIPYGSYLSPFGYSFWNPARVGYLYQPGYYGNSSGSSYGGGGGYNAGIPTRAGSYSGGGGMSSGDFSGRSGGGSSGAVSTPGPSAGSGSAAPSGGGAPSSGGSRR